MSLEVPASAFRFSAGRSLFWEMRKDIGGGNDTLFLPSSLDDRPSPAPRYGFDCNRLCQRESAYVRHAGFHDIKPPLRPLRPALFTGSQCQINGRDTTSAGVTFHDRPQLSCEKKTTVISTIDDL